MPSINDSKISFEMLLPANIKHCYRHSKQMRLLKNIPNIKGIQFIIISSQNSGLECLLKIACLMQS